MTPMSETTTYVENLHASYVQLISQMTPDQWLLLGIIAIAVLLTVATE